MLNSCCCYICIKHRISFLKICFQKSWHLSWTALNHTIFFERFCFILFCFDIWLQSDSCLEDRGQRGLHHAKQIYTHFQMLNTIIFKSFYECIKKQHFVPQNKKVRWQWQAKIHISVWMNKVFYWKFWQVYKYAFSSTFKYYMYVTFLAYV